jgi:AhpC/TSA antioxidant enzyme
MTYTLFGAGVYNILWACFTIFAPTTLFSWAQIPPPNYPELWQCIGMIVGVYGVGYVIAGFDPLRHWPIVLVGFLGKIFGPIGFLDALMRGVFPLKFGWTIVTNDLIWWIPFFLILRAAYREYHRYNETIRQDIQSALAGLAKVQTTTGVDLISRSFEKPVLLLFLRHFGCTFCKELLGELRNKVDLASYHVAFVHMVDQEVAKRYLCDFPQAESISDPSRELYRSFGLGRGDIFQLFGPRVILRGLIASVIKGYGIGPLVGDGFQMPGTFVLKDGVIVYSYRPESVADEASIEQVIACPRAER